MRKCIVGCIAVLLFACGTGGKAVQTPATQAQPEKPAEKPAETGGAVSLDRAVQETAEYFAGAVPEGAAIAVTVIDAQTSALSDYIIQELWAYLQNTGSFTLIDRQNSALMNSEIFYQLSGAVPEEDAVSIGNELKADVLIYGSVKPFDNQYRMTVYATQPERSTSLLQTKTIGELAGQFLPEKTLDAAIERSVREMGKDLAARTRVNIDRISYMGYETVSGFSRYLVENIRHQAAGQNLYQMVEDRTALGALIEGSFYPQDGGIAVLLKMVSAYDKSWLGQSKFVIPQSELDKLGLSILPPNTSLTQLERVNRAIDPYGGKGNAFSFTVKPERADAIYYDGDRLSFTVYAEKDCYFKITHVDVHGKQSVLYPVYEQDNNFIKAGESRRIPDRSFTIDLHEPFGVEYVLAAAYTEQFAVGADDAESAVDVSVETISLGLRGATRVQNKPGAVITDTELLPVSAARFSYSILP
jgi:hypothetical protein